MGHKGEHPAKQKSAERAADKTDRKNKDGAGECQAPNYHKMHMCVLRHMGQMQLFDDLSADPLWRCSRCGCVSNRRANLCQPYDL